MKTNSNDGNPPKWALCFLRSICPEDLYEEIEGDLIQKYKCDVKKFGKRRARQKFGWNTVFFFRPGILFRNKLSIKQNQLHMLLNYLTLASRSLIRNKVFAIVNVLGLSVSMVVCILIFLYVRFELSYDDFHRGTDNIYRPYKI